MDGSPKFAMYSTLSGGVVNMIGDWLFVFPLNMGMAGAALAVYGVLGTVAALFTSIFSGIGQAVCLFCVYFLQSMVRPKMATLVSLLRGIVLNGTFLMVFPLIWGGNGIWWAIFAAELVTMLIAFFLRLHFIGVRLMQKQTIQANQKKIENRALVVTVLVNVVTAGAGVGMYFLTGLTTMFLDGMYSTIALASTVIALLISIYSRKRTKNHPGGLYFMEPLYALLKVFMIFTVLVTGIVMSIPVVIEYFVHGSGEVMDAGAVPWYAIFATSVCLGLSLFNRIQFKKTNCTSMLLRTEAQTNLIDGLQSAGIGLAFFIIQLIPRDSALEFLHYTGDFFISLVIIAISVKDPVVLLLDSFRELTDGIAKDKDIYAAVEEATGLQPSEFTVIKTGMMIRVCIPVKQITEEDIQAKDRMLATLRLRYENAEIVYVA